MPHPAEFIDRHTRSFVWLCGLSAAIAFGLCNWLGWDQPGQIVIVLLLSALTFVALAMLAMLMAEKWFDELDATSSEWSPVSKRGNPKTAFAHGQKSRIKFDHTGDFLRMVAQEMQPGSDGSYFGHGQSPWKERRGHTATLSAPPARSFAEALQIPRPLPRSSLASYVPPAPPPLPVAAQTAPPPILFSHPVPPVATAFVPNPPPLPPAITKQSGPGPVVTLGTALGHGAMRPKPPRHRPN